MSLVDFTDPAGQVSEECLAALVDQGNATSENKEGFAGSEADSTSDSEAGTSGDGDENDRDRVIMDFLNKNPSAVAKFLSQGKYCFESLVKKNRGKVLSIIEQDYEAFAEAFELYPKTINKLLDEEESFLHNFLQGNQRALDRYLQIKPQSLAAYFESYPAELNRLFYKHPETLSQFCDDHPSFMASWLQHRQATVQKYLVDNPALMWNHLRAHSAYRTGGQSFGRCFTMALMIEIPEEQEHLIREPIQWVLPKDPKRRREKLREMAARGESEVAIRGTAAGQVFIDNDTILEEDATLKLTEEELNHLNGVSDGSQPERLKWYKGRMHHIKENGVAMTRHDLNVQKPSPDVKIGPYQRAKSRIFRELHPSLEDEDASSAHLESHASKNKDTEVNSSEASQDEHTDHQDNASKSDDDLPSPRQQPPPATTSDTDLDDCDPLPNMSESDSDVPLSRRQRGYTQRQEYNEDEADFFGDTESSDSNNDSRVPRSGTRPNTARKRLFRSAGQNGCGNVGNRFGARRLSVFALDGHTENVSSKRDETFPRGMNNSDSQDRGDHNTPCRVLVEYPAPLDLIDASRSEPLSGKWRLFEEDIAIAHMLNIRDEQIVHGEERFREISKRLVEANGINRTWVAVKNFWNRAGRARSGFDERKNKKAPLATSQQGRSAETYRTKAQIARDEELADSGTSHPVSARTSRSRSARISVPATPRTSKSKKSPITPDLTPSNTTLALNGQLYSSLSPRGPTFSLEEVQAMQASLQNKLQEQLAVQMQAYVEQSNKQMADQMKIFKETLAAVAAAATPSPTESLCPTQSSGVTSGRKRAREDFEASRQTNDTDEPSRKQSRPSPLDIDNISNFVSQDQPPKSLKKPYLLRHTSTQEAEYHSPDRETPTRSGTHADQEQALKLMQGNGRNDLSNLSWQKGVRDRSKMRPVKYC